MYDIAIKILQQYIFVFLHYSASTHHHNGLVFMKFYDNIDRSPVFDYKYDSIYVNVVQFHGWHPPLSKKCWP
jgi:hypothetical protein